MAQANRDIYRMDQRLASAAKSMQNNPDLSARNKQLITKFIDYTRFQGKSKQTQYKRLYNLYIVARELGKDFEKLTREDTEKYIADIHSSNLAPKTQQVRKMSLKLMIKWLAVTEENKKVQKLWKWMQPNLKTPLLIRSDEEALKVDKANLLSEEDVLAFSKSVRGQDRAFILTIYESGARIGEMLNLRKRDITIEKGGYALLDLRGKTGRRQVPVKNCVPDLLRWVNDLPDDPDQPLWIVEGHRGKGRPYEYRSMKRHIYGIAKKYWVPDWSEKKIRERLHLHNFRHSRATNCAMRGWSEYEMCVFFGWKIGSKVPSVYIKLSGKDLLRRVKMDNGEVEEKVAPSKLVTNECPSCHKKQSPTNSLCDKCGTPLTLQEFAVQHQKRAQFENKLDKFAVLMERMMGMDSDEKISAKEIKKIMKV